MATRGESRPSPAKVAARTLERASELAGRASIRPERGLLAGALGVNLWLLALALPTLYARAPDRVALAPLLLPAPLLLALGLARRTAPALLLGVPLATLAPFALPELGAARREPALVAVLALTLAAYLVASLAWLGRTVSPLDAGSASTPRTDRRTLGPVEGELAARWLARRRIDRLLAVVTAGVPALLVGLTTLRPSVQTALARGFAHAERVEALLVLVAGLGGAVTIALGVVRPWVHALDEARRAEEA